MGSASKFLLILVPVSFLVLACACACGSQGSAQPVHAVPDGNWVFTTNSAVFTNSAGKIGGSIKGSAGTLSSSLYISSPAFGPLCFSSSPLPVYPYSGTLQNDRIDLSFSFDPMVSGTLQGTISGDTFSGTYSLSGQCVSSDHGTVTGMRVRSLTGTWQGTDQYGGLVTLQLSEQPLNTASGVIPLQANFTVANGSTCLPSGAYDFLPDYDLTDASHEVVGDQVAIYGSLRYGALGFPFQFRGTVTNPSATTIIAATYSTWSGCAYVPVILSRVQ